MKVRAVFIRHEINWTQTLIIAAQRGGKTALDYVAGILSLRRDQKDVRFGIDTDAQRSSRD